MLPLMLACLPTRLVPVVRVFVEIQRKRLLVTMPSSDPEAKNASGLTPTQTKALNERDPEEHERAIIQSIKEVSSSHFRYAEMD